MYIEELDRLVRCDELQLIVLGAVGSPALDFTEITGISSM